MQSSPNGDSKLPTLFRWFSFRSEWGLLLAVIMVLLLTSLLDSQHNYWRQPGDSAGEILRETSMLGIFALGAAIVIIAGGIDLSSGSMIAFSGTVCATFMLLLAPVEMKSRAPVGLGIIALSIAGTLLISLLIGSLHAWLITVVELPPFVATLATLVGLRSVARALVSFVYEGASKIPIYDRSFRALGSSIWVPVSLFAVLSVLTWVLMSWTVTGRRLYALGGNEHAARLSGIQTDRLKWLAYCLSALMAAIAGILYVGYGGGAFPETQGKGYELNAIAAAVVGGCSLRGGSGTIPGTVLGALFLRVVNDSVAKIIKATADIYEGIIVGGVVVVAVALTQFRQAGAGGKRFFAGALGLVNIVNLALTAGLLAMLFGQKADAAGWTLGGVVTLVALIVLGLFRVLEGRQRDVPKR
jgi:ribose/xylose/arabinose/galactoside ABC-type transport system permease subunit